MAMMPPKKKLPDYAVDHLAEWIKRGAPMPEDGSKVAEEGLLSGSDALDSDEYNAANEAINQYFEQECGG